MKHLDFEITWKGGKIQLTGKTPNKGHVQYMYFILFFFYCGFSFYVKEPPVHSNFLTDSISGNRFWVFKDTTLQPSYPQDISLFGSGMQTESIETAVWWEDVAKTYFFKGDRFVWIICQEVKYLSRTNIEGETQAFRVVAEI